MTQQDSLTTRPARVSPGGYLICPRCPMWHRLCYSGPPSAWSDRGPFFCNWCGGVFHLPRGYVVVEEVL